MHLPNTSLEIVVYSLAGLVLFVIGYQIGRWIHAFTANTVLRQKEQDLFTAQKGFKQLYEAELNNVKAENAKLTEDVKQLNTRVEEYRKKAAGYGGLFSAGGKKADAMYALLLENEALEDALYHQNTKLQQERADAVKEQLRATGYRRVLMSQLMNDERIKSYIAEVLADEKRLPPVDGGNNNALPSPTAAER